MGKIYHSLIVREDNVWAVQFGSFDRDDVVFERQDQRDHGVRAKDLKIVTSDGLQSSIDAIVQAMNDADRVAAMNAPAKTVRVTENERSLMLAIATSEYGDYITDAVWVNCLWGWSETRKFPGVMASLVRKGWATTDGEACALTDAGADVAIALADDPSKIKEKRPTRNCQHRDDGRGRCIDCGEFLDTWKD